jgi:hypothetical protein
MRLGNNRMDREHDKLSLDTSTLRPKELGGDGKHLCEPFQHFAPNVPFVILLGLSLVSIVCRLILLLK